MSIFGPHDPSTGLCEDCPPVGYPTDKTRCLPCPRRTSERTVVTIDTAGLGELIERATKGPWKFVPWHIEEGASAVRAPEGWAICFTASDADAALIAAAVNALPALLDRVQVLEGALREMLWAFIEAPTVPDSPEALSIQQTDAETAARQALQKDDGSVCAPNLPHRSPPDD